MTISAHEHLTKILSEPRTPLAQIYKAYQIHRELTLQLKEDLPEAYRDSVSLLLYRAGVLHLSVRTSALKMRLSYEKQNLIEILRKKSAWAGIKDIKIKIV